MRKLCRWFGVSPSGFYASQTRPESRRALDDRRLTVLLHASFAGGRGYYGSPRIHDDFIEWGEHVSRKRIIRLKQAEGLQARVRKRYKVTTDSNHDQPIADNLLRPRWTLQIRPLIDGSKPAISGQRPRPVQFYFASTSARKSVWTLVRQLRGPHLSTCA